VFCGLTINVRMSLNDPGLQLGTINPLHVMRCLLSVVLRGAISSSEVKITRTNMMYILYILNDIGYAKYDWMKRPQVEKC
jgi:hypothetical protein